MFKKFFLNLKLLWHGFFYGMSGAEKIINSPSALSSDGVEIIQQKAGVGGVFADLLEEKKTQEVKEMVDAYYRIYREADKLDVSNIIIVSEDENGVVFGMNGSVRKKTKADFMKHPPVFNPDNIPLRVIQDNKHIENISDISQSLFNYDTTLIVKRDNFIPRFPIEKIVKKMVVRSLNEEDVLVDLYIPSEASQFGKIDAIVISNIRKMMDNKIYKSDLTDFLEFEWYSDKAWNSEDVCHFKYIIQSLVGINLFDGNIVLTYLSKIVYDGIDLTEKHHTKELDNKYAIGAPKRDDIDIFTYTRHLQKKENKKEENKINFNNLNNIKFTLNKNEDSN